jgi:hypothetical protein
MVEQSRTSSSEGRRVEDRRKTAPPTEGPDRRQASAVPALIAAPMPPRTKYRFCRTITAGVTVTDKHHG